MVAVKLAEALLRRKELEGKVKVLALIKQNMLVDTMVKRVKVSDGFDDLTIAYNRLHPSDVTAEFDYYSRQLRLCDAAIQQANWTVQVPDAHADFMQDFKRPPDDGKVAKPAA
jgi:hypothetical protein